MGREGNHDEVVALTMEKKRHTTRATQIARACFETTNGMPTATMRNQQQHQCILSFRTAWLCFVVVGGQRCRSGAKKSIEIVAVICLVHCY